jgi:cell division protein FtsB
VGEYRGFSMKLWIDKFSEKFKVTLKNELGHTAELGADLFGNISRINNVVEAIPKLLAQEREQLATLHRQVENAKEEIQKPFPQDAELIEKTARLNVLNALLSVNEHEDDKNVPDDSEPQCVGKPSIKKMLRQFEKSTPVAAGSSRETEMDL